MEPGVFKGCNDNKREAVVLRVRENRRIPKDSNWEEMEEEKRKGKPCDSGSFKNIKMRA